MNNDTSSKRSESQYYDDDDDDKSSSVLIPGLPDHLAQQCLSAVPPSLLYGVCRSWRRFIYSPSFPPFYCLYALLSPSSSMAASLSSSSSIGKPEGPPSSIEFLCLDPVSSKWSQLPSPPPEPPLRILHRHPSFISRTLTVQSLAVSGRLLLVAGTTHNFLPALGRPLCFDPSTGEWFSGPPFTAPRRWCATGSVHGQVYVASGVGSGYQGDVARALEKWDVEQKPADWKWEKLSSLNNGRFCREAVEGVGYKGKLCMVNIKGNAVKEGAVYDVTADQWEKMPRGMLAGWNGPAAGDGDDEIYMVDESIGSLSRYKAEDDSWEEVIQSSEYLKGAERIAVERGKVCTVSGRGRWVTVVDVAAQPARIWVVNPPPEMEFIAVHILPRMKSVEN
ncbi:PREDICTED: F-box/kelch-repeat protein SKIP25-like [Ipomoea nil]|uniref:F-box/kelch-repeat protein SKIP25-like n=1 Tax=Ipomoea nil TaxID=35883 RepID=UPI000900BE62|nr:PREDICTED: F-box/kelch-repeat protein SKIP25-like [Ipomoea nil]